MPFRPAYTPTRQHSPRMTRHEIATTSHPPHISRGGMRGRMTHDTCHAAAHEASVLCSARIVCAFFGHSPLPLSSCHRLVSAYGAASASKGFCGCLSACLGVGLVMSLSASSCRPQWELVGFWFGFCWSLGFPMVPPEGVCRCCWMCGCLRLHPSVSVYVGRRL